MYCSKFVPDLTKLYQSNGIKDTKSMHKPKFKSDLLTKYRDNRKTLPWEHHIGCQMCQISFSKTTEKVKKKRKKKLHDFFWKGCMNFFTTVTNVPTVKKILTFKNINLTYLTTDVMFSGQPFAILVMFFVESLHDFCVNR